MASPDVVEVVAARLEQQLDGARVVYRHAVPRTPESRYVVVRSNVGVGTAENLADATDYRAPTVWATSVSIDDDPETAAREAAWCSTRVVVAFDGWRPPIGRAAWPAEHVSSLPTQRDDALPGVVFFAVEQFSLGYQP